MISIQNRHHTSSILRKPFGSAVSSSPWNGLDFHRPTSQNRTTVQVFPSGLDNMFSFARTIDPKTMRRWLAAHSVRFKMY